VAPVSTIDFGSVAPDDTQSASNFFQGGPSSTSALRRRGSPQERPDGSAKVADADLTTRSDDAGSFPADREAALFGPAGSDDRAAYAVSKFHVGVFLYELVTQLLFPLSLPVVLCKDGLSGAQSKMYLPRCNVAHVFGTILSWVYTLVQIAPIVLCAVFGIQWLMPLAITAFAFPIFRVVTIAGKYASFSREDYRRKLRDPDYNLRADILIQSWFKEVAEAKIAEQLDDAEHYVGTALDELPLLRLLDGTTCCPRRYLWLLLHRVYREPPPTAALAMVSVASHALVAAPLVAYWVHFRFVESYEDFYGVPGSLPELFAVLSLMLQFFFIAPPVFLFMAIAATHHWRGHRVQRMLLNAVMPSGHVRISGDPAMLRLSAGCNLFGWERMRYVARYFGRVYANRASFNTISTVAVSALAFLKLAFDRIVFGGDLFDHTHLALTVFVAFVFVVTAVLAFLSILFAVLTNRADERAAELLANEELALFFVTADTHPGAPARDTSSNTNNSGASDDDDDDDVAHITNVEKTSAAGTPPQQATTTTKPPGMGRREAETLYYRLKAVRAAIGLRQRVEPVEIMYAPARPRMLAGYVAFLASATTVTVALFLSPNVGG